MQIAVSSCLIAYGRQKNACETHHTYKHSQKNMDSHPLMSQ